MGKLPSMLLDLDPPYRDPWPTVVDRTNRSEASGRNLDMSILEFKVQIYSFAKKFRFRRLRIRAR